MSVTVTISGMPTDGNKSTGVTPVTVGSGETDIIVTLDAPATLAGIGYESGFAGSEVSIYMNVAEPGATASWLPLNKSGTQLTATVTAGAVEKLDYDDLYLTDSVKLVVDSAQTSSKTMYLVWYRTS